MTLFGVSALLAGVTSFFMGIFVYLNGQNEKVNRTWLGVTFSVTIWGFGSFIATHPSNIGFSMLFWKLTYIGVIYVPVFFFHFVCVFLKIDRSKFIKFLYLLASFYLVSYLFFDDTFLGGINTIFEGLHWCGYPGPIFITFYVSFYLGLNLYSFYLLFKKLKSSSGIEKTQLFYLIIGSAIGWIGSEGCFAGVWNIPIYPLSNFLTAIYPIILGYAIVRHQLLEIDVIIKKTLIYSVLITIITLLYFLMVYAIERLSSVYIGYHSPLLSVAIITFFILIFTPLKNRIQHIIDKYFFRGSIDQIDAEKRLLESELERSERLKSLATLASGMAHEIKNPLTSIKTFSEFVKTKGGDPEFKEKFEKIVPQEIDKITNIVNQLLDYSKTDRTRLTECNIHDILDYVLELHNNELMRRGIRLQKAYGAQNPNITCDANKLKQAFINLVLNAIEAMGENGVLTVGTEGADHLVVMVKDTGPGISPANIPHLFDPFFTTKDSGTGLGLFVTHQIISSNGGKISVSSEEGKGTEFKVEF
ncbi:MAG: ATP-binding protein [Candidatus Omnitrophica bacterium]|nr:ATP-binding protein [Patescibacteria group bacterium]MDD5487935.1 ATP-binding protein [Candidatus Omnitrophota bacterium]